MKELTLTKQNEISFKKGLEEKCVSLQTDDFVFLAIYFFSELRGTVHLELYVNSSMG